jgi:hypothetical protein
MSKADHQHSLGALARKHPVEHRALTTRSGPRTSRMTNRPSPRSVRWKPSTRPAGQTEAAATLTSVICRAAVIKILAGEVSLT